jgi:hypothetical protein
MQKETISEQEIHFFSEGNFADSSYRNFEWNFDPFFHRCHQHGCQLLELWPCPYITSPTFTTVWPNPLARPRKGFPRKFVKHKQGVELSFSGMSWHEQRCHTQ